MNMKKYMIFALCCVFTAGVLSGCGSKPKNDEKGDTTVSAAKSEAPKEKFVKMAAEANKKMPLVVPGGLRQDKEEALSKTEYKYHYTFTKEPAVSAEEFVRSTKPMLSMGLKTVKDDNVDMLRKEKMTLIYAYHKMDGSLFAEVRILPEEYSK